MNKKRWLFCLCMIYGLSFFAVPKSVAQDGYQEFHDLVAELKEKLTADVAALEEQRNAEIQAVEEGKLGLLNQEKAEIEKEVEYIRQKNEEGEDMREREKSVQKRHHWVERESYAVVKEIRDISDKYNRQISDLRESDLRQVVTLGQQYGQGTDVIVEYLGVNDPPINNSQADALAKSTLRSLSTASETYATVNNGAYADNIEQLTGAVPPYINTSYCDEEISGFRYVCEMSPEGYTFTAVPTDQSGSTTFTITTGGVLTP